MNIQTQKLLPAVLLSMSAVSAISSAAQATILKVDTNSAVPAVLVNQPDINTLERTPERLLAYEKSLTKETNAKKRCIDDFTSESQSFSGRVQLDDSRSDCFR
jgi:hypothetical protein